jgi:Papain-like cysteine protease AvrRpt2
MSSTLAAAIPYERQDDPRTNRTCGAASLSMVYRSFGKAIPQAEIWSRISKQNHLGSLAGATYLMTQDALNRGFASVALRARHPLQALRLCQDKGIRAILSYRLQKDSATGHYSVLVEIDGEDVVLHDPYFGPSRRLSHAALLELWQPTFPRSEITGGMLIGIADRTATLPPCRICGALVPPAVVCPICNKSVPLQPAALLGCVEVDCPERMWNLVCCPFCDHTWSFGSRPSSEAASGEPRSLLADLGPVFAEMDKFASLLRSTPGVADNAKVREQLDLLLASKENLRLAQSEVVANRAAQSSWLSELRLKCQADEKELRRRKSEIEAPAPPPDGDALAAALVKRLEASD